MQIIASTAARFFNPTNQVEELNKAGDKVKVTDRSLHNSYTIVPSSTPQGAPDWIRKDPMFSALVKEKRIIVVQVLESEEDAGSGPQKPATPPASTGWGAKPPGLGQGFQQPAQQTGLPEKK